MRRDESQFINTLESAKVKKCYKNFKWRNIQNKMAESSKLHKIVLVTRVQLCNTYTHTHMCPA